MSENEASLSPIRTIFIDPSALLDVVSFDSYEEAKDWAWTKAEEFHGTLGSVGQGKSYSPDAYSTDYLVVAVSGPGRSVHLANVAQTLPAASIIQLVRGFWSAPEVQRDRHAARRHGVARTLLWYQLQAADSGPERRRLLRLIALATIRAIQRGHDARAVFAVLHQSLRSGIVPAIAHRVGTEGTIARLHALNHSIARHAPPVLPVGDT